MYLVNEHCGKKKCCESSQTYFSQHQTQIFSKWKSFQIYEPKNNFCLMKKICNKTILCMQLHIVNGQMKLIRKICTETNVVEFFNKSNKFLICNTNTIEIWRLDDMSHETLALKEEETPCCSRLNNNDDELVCIYSENLNFWIKNNDGIWIHSQIIPLRSIAFAEFNESGNFLLHRFRSFLFAKEKIDSKWASAYEFKKKSLDMLCFLYDEKLAHLERSGTIVIWKISAQKMNRVKLQTIQLVEQSDYSFYCNCYIRYIQSKKLLFAFNENKCYFFNQNNHQFIINLIIEFTKNRYIEVINCFDGNYLFIKQRNLILNKVPQKLLFPQLNY